MPKNKQVIFKDLGILDYKTCWDYQEKLFDATAALKIENRNNNSGFPTPNYLLFVEHPHVYTLGKSGNEANLLISEKTLEDKDASYYKINRGGDITYHGPGQLVAYPILDLDNFFTDIHKYLRFLEEVIILTMAEFGVKGERSRGETGVWIDIADPGKARKICAFGVRCSRWITMHGWGFNVNADLEYFNNIIPCGIQNKGVTSLNKELNIKEVNMNEVKEKLTKHFCTLFECELISEKSLSPLV